MRITEPMTMATDYLVGMCASVWGWRLARRGRSTRQWAVVWWAAAFGALALAAFAGGTHHGLSLLLGARGARLLWKLTVLLIGVASFAVLAAVFTARVHGRPRRWLLAAATAKLALYTVWTLAHDDFIWVILDYGGSMVVALILQAEAWRRREPAAPWIIAAILVSFAAAGIQASRLAIHEHFNHNDLYHVIQIGGLYLFYRGALLTRDAGDADARRLQNENLSPRRT